MTAARIRAQFPTSDGFGDQLKGCCRPPFVWASYNISRYIGRHSSRENNVPYCSHYSSSKMSGPGKFPRVESNVPPVTQALATLAGTDHDVDRDRVLQYINLKGQQDFSVVVLRCFESFSLEACVSWQRSHLSHHCCCCCCCCFLTLTDPLRIQPWSQDRRNQTKSTGNRR